MPELEPITREEMLLDGQDLEPITRKEMFIKRIYDKTQVVPEPITREEMFLKKAGDETTDVTIEQLNVSANGTYSESGKAYSPVIVNVPAPPIPDNAYLLNEVEGLPSDIATFSDGSNLPMPKLQVGIEPQQDLHGYDNPWVGGAGKNKFKTDFENTTINGTTITKTSDGRVLTSGVPTSAFDFVIGHVSLPAGSYILNGCPANGSADKYRLQVTDYPVVNNLGLDYGSGVSFTLEHDMEIAVRIQVYTGARATLEYKPMIRLATVSDATFAPYSNICPISGWDEVNVTVADDTTDPTTENVYTIDLDGTRYGGELDVVNGVLTVDRAIVDIDGSENGWSTDQVGTQNRRRFTCTGLPSLGTSEDTTFDAISNMFVNTKSSDYINMDNVFILRYLSQYRTNRIDIMTETYQDLTAFKSFLSNSNLTVVYELATPSTIQLTPTQVKSLLGSNNVWCDTGKIEELEYFSKEV